MWYDVLLLIHNSQANLDRPDSTMVSNTPATPSSLLDRTTAKDHIHQGLRHDDPDTSLNSNRNDDDSTNTTQSIFSIPDDTQVYFNDSDLKLYSFVSQEEGKERGWNG